MFDLKQNLSTCPTNVLTNGSEQTFTRKTNPQELSPIYVYIYHYMFFLHFNFSLRTDINIPNYPPPLYPRHPSNGISKTTIEYTILHVNELDVFWDKNILSIQIKGCHFEIWNQGTKGVQSKQAKNDRCQSTVGMFRVV